ncbi:S-layer homology domain-containing protein [Agathobaculum sp.]|uniref:S-layer homology domain-containing protein n=1 Tax=Agathobaculum sp. TaxID=2048138 RepID=UPI00352037D5
MFAGAAFTDQADIKVDAEVVDTLVSLGVINGYTDGSFKPNDTVTRAEMAKMIYVLRTGKSDASAYNNEKTTFADINGHWAAGYVKYCQSLGIIAGQSATKFAPDQTVTAQEAAKMLLVTLGYDASKAGLVGASWASKTNALADENGLLKDVNTSFTGPCPRQYAAQLMYNAIFANTVVLRDGEYTKYGTNNSKNPTVGEKYMGLEEFTGTFEGNADVQSTLKDGEIQVAGTADNKGYTAKATYKMNNDLIGEEVTVLYKDHKNGTDGKLDSKDIVFGVYATGETTVYNITSGDLQNGDNDKIKFNDKQYKAKATINVSVNYVGSAASTARSVFQKNGTYYGDKADTIKFIAKDGEITTAYVNTYTLARVTAVNSTKVSINNGVGAVEFENNNIYNGIKKDDIVVVQTLYAAKADNDDARTTVTKAEVQSGKLDGYKGTEKVTFGGKTYTVLDGKLAATTIDSDFETTVADQIGESYDFYFVGDYVAAVKMTSDGAKNYAVVMGITGKADNKANPLKAAIKKADGSEVTVELDTDGITNLDENSVYLIKYSETNSTKIKIKEAAKETAKAEGYVKDTKTFDKIVTSADAPLFVKKNGDYYVYTIRNLNNTAAKTNSAKILDDGKVVAAYIDSDSTPSGASSDTVYGIVSKANGTVKIDDTYYTEFAADVFDKTGASETKKVLIEGTSSKLSKGDLVSFDVASNDIYTDSDIHVYTDGKMDGKNNTNVKATWVKEYDAKGEILTTWNSIVKNSSGSFEGKKKADGTDDITVAAFDDDAVIAFVSVDDEKATTDNGVPAFDGVKGYKNVLVVTDGTKIVGLFVDTDNNIENLKSLSASNYQLAVAAPKATIAKGSNLNKDLSVEADKATAVAGNEIKYTVTIPAGTKAESSAKIVTIALPKDVTAKSGAEVAISGDNTNVTANGTTGFKISTTETTAETTVVFTVTVNSGVSAAIAAPTFTVA